MDVAGVLPGASRWRPAADMGRAIGRRAETGTQGLLETTHECDMTSARAVTDPATSAELRADAAQRERECRGFGRNGLEECSSAGRCAWVEESRRWHASSAAVDPCSNPTAKGRRRRRRLQGLLESRRPYTAVACLTALSMERDRQKQVDERGPAQPSSCAVAGRGCAPAALALGLPCCEAVREGSASGARGRRSRHR